MRGSEVQLGAGTELWAAGGLICGCISLGRGPDKDNTEGLRSALARLRNRTGPSLPQQPTPPASPLPLASTHSNAHGHAHAHIAERGAGGRCSSYCQESSPNSALAALKSSEAGQRAAASTGSSVKGSAADGSHINGLAHHVSTQWLNRRYAAENP